MNLILNLYQIATPMDHHPVPSDRRKICR